MFLTIPFVYVIGPYAVQFGHNWMKTIPRTANIGRGRMPSPICLLEEFFEPNYFQIGQGKKLARIPRYFIGARIDGLPRT